MTKVETKACEEGDEISRRDLENILNALKPFFAGEGN